MPTGRSTERASTFLQRRPPSRSARAAACAHAPGVPFARKRPSPRPEPPRATLHSTGTKERGTRMGTRVLIVEDDRHIIESLSFVLQREGFSVAAALDGEAAMQRLRSDPPDLVILDVMLPRMNGFEVLKALRADAALQAMPVIVLTAKGQKQDRRLAE